MRNGIWRERNRPRSYYKKCNRAFPVCGIFSWRAENLLESRSPRLRRFRDSSNGLWKTLHFLTLSTNNGRNQRKSWRVNFHDHHRCASRSHNETQLKWFGITAATSVAWGQAWKKTRQCGRMVCVWDHYFIEAQKGKKILFEKLFSRNKKINSLTEVKESEYLTASGINPFRNKQQEIIAQYTWPTLLRVFVRENRAKC